MFFRKKISRSLYNKYLGIREIDTRISVRELQEIKKLEFQFLAISALIGVVFVLGFYIPIYVFPQFFNGQVIEVNFFGIEIQIRWVREFANLFLTYIELYFLSIAGIFMIQKLAAVLDFPAINSKHYELHQRNIELLCLERKQKKEKEIGLDPFKGLSSVQLLFMIFISRFKAILSNLLIRFLLQRFAGRYVFKAMIDMVGIPVYAFWNAFTMKKLFNDAKFYILSVELTDFLAEKLEFEVEVKHELSKKIHEILKSVVRLKREYSYVNYYFSSRMLESLKVEIETSNEDTVTELLTHHSNPRVLQFIHLVFTTGIILDGKISRQERKYILNFNRISTFKESPLNSITPFLKAYQDGRGIEYIKQQRWI